MTTDCSTDSLHFHDAFRREVVADFDGGDVSSDAGGLLLREVEIRAGIIAEFAGCFRDFRNPLFTEHSVLELIAQRVYGLCLGYEDLNDHDALRQDPLIATLVGKLDPKGQDRRREQDKGKALAGKSTLNRLELTREDASAAERYKKIVIDQAAVDRLFVKWFIDAHEKAPEEIVLDLDATDDPVHGHQEGRFFHGYYDEYCYLPLYIFCGEFLLCARLRTADHDGAAGSVEEIERIVAQIRERWPGVRIVIRGDSGFCRDEIMTFCERNHLRYVLGLARNSRLMRMVAAEMEQVKAEYEKTKEPARILKDLAYRTRETWSRTRRVVAKVEFIPGKPNPRFVVTNLPRKESAARTLYEVRYCGRGDMENRIKEQQLHMFADRTSTAFLRSNQIRLTFSSVAYILMQTLRRVGLAGTELEKAQCTTIRVKLLKIGARVKVTVRRIWVAMSSGCPYREIFARILGNIRRWRPQIV